MGKAGQILLWVDVFVNICSKECIIETGGALYEDPRSKQRPHG